MKPFNNKGFTLIELMITVAIVAILAAVALPNYKNYVIRAARVQAQTELLDLASRQEKIYLNSNAYTGNVSAAYDGTATTGGLGRTSSKTLDGKYDLSVALGTGSQSFVLTATPVTGMQQAGDGSLSISENGQKLWGSATW